MCTKVYSIHHNIKKYPPGGQKLEVEHNNKKIILITIIIKVWQVGLYFAMNRHICTYVCMNV